MTPGRRGPRDRRRPGGQARGVPVGLAAGGVPPFFAVVDTVAGLVAAVGLAYFTFRLIVLAKRRLLWRVRRKLILSYIFIGFVPALLLVAFSLLCGFLLFYNFSSYLVQSRLRALSEQARFLAQSTALEIQRAGGRDVAAIIARRQASAAEKYPGRLDRRRAGRLARAATPDQPNRPLQTAEFRIRLLTPVPGRTSSRRAACRRGSTVRGSRASSPTRTGGRRRRGR